MFEKEKENETPTGKPRLPTIETLSASVAAAENSYDLINAPTYELYVAGMERIGAGEMTLTREEWIEMVELMQEEKNSVASVLDDPHNIEKLLGALGIDRETIKAHNCRLEDLLNGEALEVVGPTIDGEQFNISEYAGEVVLIHFWRCQCGPCREKLPEIKKLLDSYEGRGFKVVGVCGDDDLDQVREVAKSEGITWPTICTGKADNPIIENIKLWIYPVMLLQNREGKIVEANPAITRLPEVIGGLLGAPRGPG